MFTLHSFYRPTEVCKLVLGLFLKNMFLFEKMSTDHRYATYIIFLISFPTNPQHAANAKLKLNNGNKLSEKHISNAIRKGYWDENR